MILIFEVVEYLFGDNNPMGEYDIPLQKLTCSFPYLLFKVKFYLDVIVCCAVIKSYIAIGLKNFLKFFDFTNKIIFKLVLYSEVKLNVFIQLVREICSQWP